MIEKEATKQLKIMLECRKRQKEEFKECVTCDKDIQALETVLKLLRKKNNKINRIKKYCNLLEEENMEKDLEIIGAEEYTKASMGEIIENYYTANEDCIPKKLIRDKLYEVAQKRKKYWGKEYPQQLSKAEFIESVKMLGVIKFCEESLEKER